MLRKFPIFPFKIIFLKLFLRSHIVIYVIRRTRCAPRAPCRILKEGSNHIFLGKLYGKISNHIFTITPLSQTELDRFRCTKLIWGRANMFHPRSTPCRIPAFLRRVSTFTALERAVAEKSIQLGSDDWERLFEEIRAADTGMHSSGGGFS